MCRTKPEQPIKTYVCMIKPGTWHNFADLGVSFSCNQSWYIVCTRDETMKLVLGSHLGVQVSHLTGKRRVLGQLWYLKDNIDWFESRHRLGMQKDSEKFDAVIDTYSKLLFQWLTLPVMQVALGRVLWGLVPDPTCTWNLFVTQYPAWICIFIPVPPLVCSDVL